MRILVLSWKCILHPAAGGAETYTHEVMRHWVRLGHEVRLFTARADGLSEEQVVDGVRTTRRGHRYTVYNQARQFYAREGLGRFDVVVDTINTRPFLTPAWVRDVPVVALAHQVAREVWKEEFPHPVAYVGRRFLEPRWLRAYRDTPVVTVSPSSEDSLRSYGLHQVSVIGMGIAPPEELPTGPRATTPTVLFLGRLTANKGPQHAIAAAVRARRSIPELELIIAGSGPLQSKLARALPEGVRMVGRVTEREKYELMHSSHALLVPSVREGWGMVVSEAALVGTRSIGYDVPGLRDSVPAAGGVLVAPTPVALEHAIVRYVPQWRSQTPTLGPAVGCRPWSDVAEDFLARLEEAAARAAR